MEPRILIIEDDPTLLDTLAVSYAAVGRFDDAIRMVEKALALARAGESAALLRELETRRALFERDRGVIESAPPSRAEDAARGAPRKAPRSR